MVVSGVALVDRPANQRPFLITKAEEWDALVASLAREPMSPVVKQGLLDGVAELVESMVALAGAVSNDQLSEEQAARWLDNIVRDFGRHIENAGGAPSNAPEKSDVKKALRAGDLAEDLISHLETKNEALERDRDAAVRARNEATATAARVTKALVELGRVVALTGDTKTRLIMAGVFNKHFGRPDGRA